MSSSPLDRSALPDDAPPVEDALSQAYFRDKNVADEARGPGDKAGTLFRRIAWCVVPVILFLMGADLLARWLLPPEELLPYMQWEKAYYTFKVDFFENQPSPDLLFLGSSRMRDALVPEKFSIPLSKHLGRPARVFNLGLVDSKSEEYLAIITSHLPDPPPRYVVIGFSGDEVVQVEEIKYASRFLWKLPNLFSYLNRSTFDGFQAKNVEYFIESMLCQCWYVFEYRDALAKVVQEKTMDFLGLGLSPKALETLQWSRNKLVEQVLAEDGYTLMPSAQRLDKRLKAKPDSYYIPEEAMTQSLEIFDPSSVHMLREIVEKLRAQGIKVALVETPASPYLQEKSPILHGDAFRKWMETVAEELKVLFIPFPEMTTGLTNAFYSDLNHMTERGAQLYTWLLFKQLKDENFFSEGAP